MATANSLFLLGIVLLSCSMIGASRDLDTRRSLVVNGGSPIFDITKFGAVADGKTDNVEVSANNIDKNINGGKLKMQELAHFVCHIEDMKLYT